MLIFQMEGEIEESNKDKTVPKKVKMLKKVGLKFKTKKF